jgi:hypothetical protein
MASRVAGGTYDIFSVYKTRKFRIFGSKKEKIPGGWRKLHNEELHNLNASFIVIRVTNSMKKR